MPTPSLQTCLGFKARCRSGSVTHLLLISFGAVLWHWTTSASHVTDMLRCTDQTAWAAWCGVKSDHFGPKALASSRARVKSIVSQQGLDTGMQEVAEESSDALTAALPNPLHNRIRVTALGGQRGSCLLEMAGQRILINPNLDNFPDLPPEKVHETVDYVVLTSARQTFLHKPTIARMNMGKTKFVTCSEAGNVMKNSLARNLAILASGPGGRVVLEGQNDSVPILMLVIPGKYGLPWDTLEVGFMFVNTKTGVSVGYEAFGQFLGPGAGSNFEQIPEEAYQVDYLVTPDVRETGEVIKGLHAKGTHLRGVVVLPQLKQPESNILVDFLRAEDRLIDKILGAVGETPEDLREYLKEQGPPLAQTQVFEPNLAGGPLDIE